MTREKEKKSGKDQRLLEAARLGQVIQLEIILREFQQKSKKRSNPLASLRKAIGPNNIRDPVTGFTCLHHAALNGHSQCVQLILDSGCCKVNAIDYKGSSALHLAAWAGNVQVVKILIEHCQASARRTSMNATGGKLLQQQDSPNTNADSLVDHQYQELDINLCNNDHQTPLSLAAQFGHNQVVAELLMHSANVHLRNNQLESPLDLACLNGRLETVRLLLNFAPELVEELRRSHSIATISPSQDSIEPTSATAAKSAQKRTSNTSPINHVSYKQHSRRPSGSGWSSLLRTGRSSRNVEESASSQSPDNNNRSLLVCDNTVLASPNRRATLTTTTANVSGGGGGGGQWQKLSLDYADLQQQSMDGNNNNDAQLYGGVRRRLLDHSPLHYATRRGHLQIVDLLLNSYDANVMQLTSFGSVLHEIVITYCGGGGGGSSRVTTKTATNDLGVKGDSIELIGLIFNHLSIRQQQQQQQKEATTGNVLEKFLNLMNCQQKNVFDILNEFSNYGSAAQEIRSVICEFSEQFKKATTVSSARQQHQDSILTVKPLDQQQQQQQQMHLLFNTNQQINSFVTMKRLPKHKQASISAGQQETQQFNGDDFSNSSITSNHNSQKLPLSTQTIDRRRSTNKNTTQNSQINQINFDDWNLLQANQRQAAFQLQQQQHPAISMTRSVSNLMPRMAQQPSSQFDDQFLYDDKTINNTSHAQTFVDSNCNQRASKPTTTAACSRYEQQHPLVRSQTDCSHLMGRFFGDSLSSSSNNTANQLNSIDHFPNDKFATTANQFSDKENADSRLATANLQQTQHSATINRKAINRHYHVYDHEFYPPRLLTNNSIPNATDGHHNKVNLNNQLFKQQPHQTIAIVPPLNRSESTEASFASPNRQQRHHYQQQQQQQQVNRVASFNRNSNLPPTAATIDHRQQQQQQPTIPGSSNSRLSLNIDCQSTNAQLGHSSYNSVDHQHQQQQRQMDRFVGRHASRKSTNSTSSAQNSSEASYEEDLSHHHQQFMANNMSLYHQQQQQQSFYAHSSDSNHSFEMTRKALVRDFDQMIGRELLNREHDQKINNSSDGSCGSREQLVGSSSSLIQQQHQRSILTGVSLDMDTRGERLTVSGTRITLPTARDIQLSSIAQNQVDLTGRSTMKQPKAQSQGTQTSQRPNRSIKPTMDQTKNTNQDQLRNDSRPTSSSSSSVIYDLPSTTADNSNSNLSDQRSISRTSVNLQQISSVLMTPQQHQINANKQAHQQRATSSITRPPLEKPPPLPPQISNTFASSPFRAQTSDVSDASGSLVGPQDQGCQNKPRQSSRPNNISATVAQPALAAKSAVAATPTTPINPERAFVDCTRQQPQTNATSHQLVLAIQSTHNADADSGVCTSNSPSSMSHDSTERQSSNEQQSSSCSLESNRVEHQQQTINFDSTGPNVDMLAPPSPQTAQLSIEEALLPLDIIATQEAGNQTYFNDGSTLNIDGDEDHDDDADDDEFQIDQPESSCQVPARQSCSLDAIVDWLDSSKTSEDPYAVATTLKQSQTTLDRIEAQPTNGDYENCCALQKQLEKKRHRSNDNLSLMMNLEQQNDTNTSCAIDQSDNDDATSDSKGSKEPLRDNKTHNTLVSNQSHQLVKSKCKEILLKVVVDESNNYQESSGDEVFYVEPSELKKISSSKGSRRGQRSNEMETLTDEELCASVDRKSGLIRFTLRKRRAESRDHLCDDNGEETGAGDSSPMDSSNDSAIKDQLAEQPDKTTAQTVGCKKTKLLNDDVVEKIAVEPKSVVDENEKIDSIEPRQQTTLDKQISTDSADTFDISQTTTATTTSSSSSRDSIKSIVSLKQHSIECAKEGVNDSREQHDEIASRLPVEVEDENKTENEANQEARNAEPETSGSQFSVLNGDEGRKHEQNNETSDTAMNAEELEQNKAESEQAGNKEVISIEKSTISSGQSSIEANKLVEQPAQVVLAAAARTSESKPIVAAFKPIAAVRKSQRFNQIDKFNKNPNDSTAATTAGSNTAPVETAKTTSKVSDIRQRLEQTTAINQQQKQQPNKRPAVRWPPPSAQPAQPQALPPVKPPIRTMKESDSADLNKENNGKSTAITDLADNPVVLGRVSANRLSFQRLIEEKKQTTLNGTTINNKQQQPPIINTAINRPKPAPPVKPANILLANKFNRFDTNSSQA